MICNNCGKTSEIKAEVIPFNISFEYGSNNDMQKWKFDLCECCLEKITRKFKIPVQIEDLLEV